jgi:DNA-binding NtrC family response regulator
MRAVIFTWSEVVPHAMRQALHERQCEVIRARTAAEVPELTRRLDPDVVILSASARIGPALALAREVRASGPASMALLLIVADCRGEVALEAMRAGVNDVLAEECSEAEVSAALARLIRERHAGPPPRQCAARLVGMSRSWRQINESIERVAATDSTVVITGETGTGKELTAELIHRRSRRREKPFASINCAAIPEGLFESELFGYERGAFTGAQAAREGKLQYAQGGTLFLDEIGDMNLCAQAKILRAIETRTVQRLGGNRDIAVNIRVIAATNQNLEQLTSQGRFRQDLYFRLNVARIHLPPLRDRVEDIPPLVTTLLAELSERFDRPVPSLSAEVTVLLAAYEWPGNVRELRNVIESALIFSNAGCITVADLPPYLRGLFVNAEKRRRNERERIVAALRATGGNRVGTARILGFSRMTLYRKMVKYALGDDDAHAEDEVAALSLTSPA